MTESTPTIEAIHLTKVYGRLTALRDVSFEVRPGEVVGFLGPNGAGKSTTLRILGGLVPATSGVVRLCGHPVSWQARLARRHLGYMPEMNPLPEDLRVEEYLRHRARLKEVPWRESRRRVEEVMELCDLGRKARRRLIGTLSKGYRQRVGVADAILARPKVAVLDEPTIGLDPHQILLFRELVQRLRGQMTVLLSSHILAEIERSCDRVIILNQGRIVAAGTPEGLREEFFQGERWECRHGGTPEAFAAVLAAAVPAAVLHPEPDGGSAGRALFSVRGSGQGLLGDLWREATARGLPLFSAAPAAPSLEEVFLAATRRSWDETGPVTLVAGGGAATPPANGTTGEGAR